jgi:hypothetical protein
MRERAGGAASPTPIPMLPRLCHGESVRALQSIRSTTPMIPPDSSSSGTLILCWRSIPLRRANSEVLEPDGCDRWLIEILKCPSGASRVSRQYRLDCPAHLGLRRTGQQCLDHRQIFRSMQKPAHQRELWISVRRLSAISSDELFGCFPDHHAHRASASLDNPRWGKSSAAEYVTDERQVLEELGKATPTLSLTVASDLFTPYPRHRL